MRQHLQSGQSARPLLGSQAGSRGNGFEENLKCTSSEIDFETLAESGKPLQVKITTLNFGGCGFGCTVASEVASYTGRLRAADFLGNGHITLEEPKFKFTCGGESCTYTKPSALLNVLGNAPPTNRS